jgi:hypothetical protein
MEPKPSRDRWDHYPFQPSDWGDFDTPDSGCIECDVPPPGECRIFGDRVSKRLP